MKKFTDESMSEESRKMLKLLVNGGVIGEVSIPYFPRKRVSAMIRSNFKMSSRKETGTRLTDAGCFLMVFIR